MLLVCVRFQRTQEELLAQEPESINVQAQVAPV